MLVCSSCNDLWGKGEEVLEEAHGVMLAKTCTVWCGLQVNTFIAVSELINLHTHFLSHHEEKVAHVCVSICGATTKTVMLPRITQLVAVKMTLVEVDMATMTDAQIISTGEDKR